MMSSTLEALELGWVCCDGIPEITDAVFFGGYMVVNDLDGLYRFVLWVFV